ncbi:MAG: hypothetical protein APF80_10975 [Alphaproteobacteria bacterium BRH_c36]|nr:MAG: hypothetical protein APF80_10975 [Alphaproteobacteria bacterium BRH_c36]
MPINEYASRLRWIEGERLDHVFEQCCDELETGGPVEAVVTANVTYTYRELDNRANQVARHLKARGIGPGDRVALMFDKSPETYVALIAVLKINAAYVPLDCSFPTERIAFILKDANVSALVSESVFKSILGPFSQTQVFLDEDSNAIDQQDAARLTPEEKGSDENQLAYIIYTSGTTGNPKGVVINHPSIVNFVRVAAEVYGYEPGDRVYQGLTIAFDFSVEEIWVPFAAGCTLVPAKPGVRLVAEDLADFLQEKRITAMCCVPTLLATIERDLPDLRLLLLSGEACPHGLVDRWDRPGRTILNAYGPTEATVTATVTRLYPNKPVTIGVPLPTYQVVILDEHENKQLADGETGEIGIAGIGLAEGYLNRDDLTAKVFIPDFLNLSHNPSGRIYRSGDLGRINADGEIECLGRIDTQVKIRGYRIELTEIESVLLELPEIAQAVVDTYEFDSGTKELVAYYSLVPGVEKVSHAEMAKKLRGRLPKYMVPAYYEALSVIPMTSSDKADRKNLPPPVGPRLTSGSENIVEAESEIEEALAAALSEILELESVSVEDDFFEDLNAHSLLMAQFCARVREKVSGVEISMRDIYQNPTIRKLAAKLDVDSSPSVAKKNQQPYWIASNLEYYGTWALQTVYYLALIAATTWLLRAGLFYVFAAENILYANLWGIAAVIAISTALTFVAVASKWLLIGRWQRGTIRIWSLNYFRFWLVHNLISLSPLAYFRGSPLFNLYLRMLGARIGRHAVVNCKSLPLCTDLIEIGANAVVSSEAIVQGYRAERGIIQIGSVKIGNDSFVGIGSLVDIETRIGNGAQLGHSSTLQACQVIPDGARFHGTPAEKTDIDYCPLPERNCSTTRRVLYSISQLTNILLFAVPIPVTGLYLLNIYGFSPSWAARFASPLANFLVATNILAVLSLIIGLIFIVSVPRLLALLIEDGKDYVLYGFHHGVAQFIDKWSNSEFYNTLFGDSPFITTYLTAIGWNLNKVHQTGTNFGTNQRHNSPALCEVGDATMVSDGINMVNTELSSCTFRQTKAEIGAENYLGNDIHFPPRAMVGRNCLLATKVLIPLDGSLRENTGLLGSPAFEIPRATSRDKDYSQIDETLRLQRLKKKGRFNLGTMLAFLFVKLLFINLSALYFYWAWTLESTVSYFTLTGAAAGFLAFTVLYNVFFERLSWGFKRMCPRIVSVYEPYFWRVEQYWKLCNPLLENLFQGTPYKTLILRMLGARVGRKVFDDGATITDKMLVEIGDYATLNNECVLQSHSLEEGVYKSDYIKIGQGCTVGTLAFIHYGVEAGENSIIEGNAFLMKGERVEPCSIWQGNPAKELTTKLAPTSSTSGRVPTIPQHTFSLDRSGNDENSRCGQPDPFCDAATLDCGHDQHGPVQFRKENDGSKAGIDLAESQIEFIEAGVGPPTSIGNDVGPTSTVGGALSEPTQEETATTYVCYGTVSEIIRLTDPSELLSKEELERVGSLNDPAGCARFLAGRILLRTALSWSVDDEIPPCSWKFTINRHGKPAIIAGMPDIAFNISHSVQGVAVALSKGSETGVDLESLQILGISKPIREALTDAEQASLSRLSETERWAEFIRLWTAKEACAKALGLGVSLDFRQLEVDLETMTLRLGPDLPNVGKNLVLAARKIRLDGNAYSLSVASVVRQGAEPRVRFFEARKKKSTGWMPSFRTG